jgi:hypothetical protein
MIAGRNRRSFHFELVLKVSLETRPDRFVRLADLRSGRPAKPVGLLGGIASEATGVAEVLDVNAAEFSKTVAARRRKKASDSRQRPREARRLASYPLRPKGAPVSRYRNVFTPPSRAAGA